MMGEHGRGGHGRGGHGHGRGHGHVHGCGCGCGCGCGHVGEGKWGVEGGSTFNVQRSKLNFVELWHVTLNAWREREGIREEGRG